MPLPRPLPLAIPLVVPLIVTAAGPALLRRAALAVVRWPVACQQGSRRNAMVAATVLAQRRAEREDVEEYLAGLPGPRPGPGEQAAARVAHG